MHKKCNMRGSEAGIMGKRIAGMIWMRDLKIPIDPGKDKDYPFDRINRINGTERSIAC
jgi:hypothetical protein